MQTIINFAKIRSGYSSEDLRFIKNKNKRLFRDKANGKFTFSPGNRSSDCADFRL